MSLTIDKKTFLQLLSRCYGAVAKKSTLPALSCLLIDAEHNRITVTGSDLYVTVVASSDDVEVASPVNVAVDARLIVDRVKAMPDGMVSVTMEKSVLTLKAGARRFTVSCMPGSDYPKVAEPEVGKLLVLPAATMSWLIDLTQFACSTDETRPHVNGAMLESAEGVVRMVSTDGHRLAKADAKIPEATDIDPVIFSLRTIAELRKLLSETPETVSVSFTDKTVTFTGKHAVLVSKLVDASFPPYRQVIPKTADRTVTVSRAALAQTVQAISVAADRSNGGVKLKLKKDCIDVVCHSLDGGEAFDSIAAVTQKPKPDIEIGVSAKYLLDVCGALSCEEIQLCISGELDPVKIVPLGMLDGLEYESVIMPMRV